MDLTLITLFAGAAVLLAWFVVRQRNAKERLDRDRRVAELDRQSAREGRLHKQGDVT
jgi:hypothetical protein